VFVIRDVFRCKPGQAKALAEILRRAIPAFEREDGFRNSRVMVDAVAGYWTVVLEADIDSLAAFEGHLLGAGSRPEVRRLMAGYMDLVEGGHREIYRLV
jgi:quinol monooxygenase YgiN